MDETPRAPRDWGRLARRVRQRRVELRLTQPQIHTAGGPSVSVLSKIEQAKKDDYDEIVLARLETALGWRAGSVEAILAGGEPVSLDAKPPGDDADVPATTNVAPASDDEASLQAIEQVTRIMEAMRKELADLSAKVDRLAERHQDPPDVERHRKGA